MQYRQRLTSLTLPAHTLLGLFCLITILIFTHSTLAHSQTRQAILLNIKGAIGPATQAYVDRGLQTAIKQQAKVIILKIDTPGGLSKSMRIMIKSILASPIPVIGYVAPSGARAASAGTYLLYACHIAAMAPGTNLGAATPVNLGNPGTPTSPNKDKNTQRTKTQSPSASQKKAINDARAYIRSLAQLRGRNIQWAELAVSQAASLSAEEALKLKVINFIAKDTQQLLTKANGMTVNIEGVMRKVDSNDLTITTVEPGWRTKLLSVITSPSVAYILLMVGIYGLIFEFANPGYILPGVVGAIALLLGLYALHMLPINYAGLALIILGLIFIVGEVFLPSFGALGIGGIISFVIGSILLIRTDYGGLTLPIYLILSVAIVTALFVFIVLTLAIRSKRKPVVSGQEALIGLCGQVHIDSDIMWVRIAGERWQCRSQQPLENMAWVEVTAVDGLILIVKPSKHQSIGDS